MSRPSRKKIWRSFVLPGVCIVFGVLVARGMTFHHGSKDPMQAVLGVAETFLVVIFLALGLLVIAELVSKKEARGEKPGDKKRLS